VHGYSSAGSLFFGSVARIRHLSQEARFHVCEVSQGGDRYLDASRKDV